MKKFVLNFFFVLLFPLRIYANDVDAFPQLSKSGTSKDFPLFANGKAASIYTDTNDFKVVQLTAQMLRNNEDEWKKVGIYGDFNYLTNRQTMLNYWEERVKTNGAYENTYTIGLRGIHDYPMAGATISTIPMLGYTDGVTTQPFQTPSFDVQNAPWVEYQLTSDVRGTLEIHTLPTLRIYEGRDARYAVSIDGGVPQVFSIHESDYSSEWRWNVLRGYTRRFIPLEDTANKVRVYLLDPGVTLQELLVIE